MADCSALKLIIEKGPREGETLEYTTRSVVKIGRVVRGNTIAIKDAGISSKHICIKFDGDSSKWTLSDLDSSNGTILNGQVLKANVPSFLKDGDRVKIGELTAFVVKIGVEATNRSEIQPRKQGKAESGAGADAAIERGTNGLGFDGDLGKVVVEEPVEKRKLRSRGKKAVDSKNEVQSVSFKRTLRSSTKEENASSIHTLHQIPENTTVDIRESTDHFVALEPKRRGRKPKMPLERLEDPVLHDRKPADVVPIARKSTRRGRKGLQVDQLENVQSSGLEENLNNNDESVLVDLREEVAVSKLPANTDEMVENSRLEENLDTNNESAQEQVAEKLVSTQGSEEQEAVVDQSIAHGSSEPVLEVHMDKREKVQDGCESLMKDTSLDVLSLDLEKMTLGDFFDYLEVQLPKDIREKTEKVISHIVEKARKCHEFRLQKMKMIARK